jgi:hypothetical protein
MKKCQTVERRPKSAITSLYEKLEVHRPMMNRKKNSWVKNLQTSNDDDIAV